MNKILLLPLFFIFLINPAFAQTDVVCPQGFEPVNGICPDIPVVDFDTEFPDEIVESMEEQLEGDSVFGIRGFMDDMFDSIGEFGKAQTEGFDGIDQAKKDQIMDLTDSGVETGKTSVSLWFGFHEFVVDAVFAGSPIPFDKGIVVLISFVVTTIVVTLLVWTFFKKTWKIALALIGFIAVVLVAGIQFPSI
jgi:hypothetical protein